MIVGVLCGLVTAAMHALGYVFSRRFVAGQRAGVMRLLVLGHVMMALFAAAVFPFLYTAQMPEVATFWRPLVFASLFYLIGQGSLFVALRHTDASRISPLLGLKVAVVAVLTVVVLGETLTPGQWVAVSLAVVAAWVLNASGGVLPTVSIVSTLAAVTFYSCSDIYIRELIEVMSPMGPVRGPVTAAMMSYGVCGVLCATALPWAGSRRRSDWLWASPYAATWLVGIVFMFIGFAFAGLVLTNIAVGTRGLISIGLGVLVAKMGLEHLEQRVARGVLVRRAFAAAAMVLAIALFVASAQR